MAVSSARLPVRVLQLAQANFAERHARMLARNRSRDTTTAAGGGDSSSEPEVDLSEDGF